MQHSAHCNIGYAYLTLGEPHAAARHFEESLRILGGHGDWHGESQTRLGLVRALRQLGQAGRAAGECAELLRRADARADRYMGGLALHQHRASAARAGAGGGGVRRLARGPRGAGRHGRADGPGGAAGRLLEG